MKTRRSTSQIHFERAASSQIYRPVNFFGNFIENFTEARSSVKFNEDFAEPVDTQFW